MAIRAGEFRELRLEDLSRSFGAHHALAGVSFTVRRGEFIALLGPSGCGKTTCLNLIAGLLTPSGGAIKLDERRIDQLRPEQRGFGMVFQSYALFPHLDVRRNVGFGLKMRGVARAEAARRVEEALALVRLQGQAGKMPGQLSGGQQQRVAIARAIVVEPPLVLMDEPLSNLDAKLRLEMRAEIRRIHGALGAATVYVTHDQDEAMSLADRIVVMKDGAVQQDGTPQELYEQPAHLDVAEFMGYRNRFAGRVVRVAEGRALVDVEGALVEGVARQLYAVGEAVVLAVRPEDLAAGNDGVAAQVESVEYRGRGFIGLARTAAGLEAVFRTDAAVVPGSTVRLQPDASRAIVFAA